jgi:hypothetical protein
MNSQNTLPESYQYRVYKRTLFTLKDQIQQAETTTPAAVISMEAAPVDCGIHQDHLIWKVELDEQEIGCTDPNILIHNNCMEHEV